jgi:tRNA(Ile2) C34 agmatinyltransferase TiaS
MLASFGKMGKKSASTFSNFSLFGFAIYSKTPGCVIFSLASIPKKVLQKTSSLPSRKKFQIKISIWKKRFTIHFGVLPLFL